MPASDRSTGLRVRRPGAAARAVTVVLAVAVVALASAGCSDDGPADAAPVTDSTLPPVTAGPVAATELVTGDCLTGFAIGVSERIRIDSAEVVSCTGTHDLEVFAVFSLAQTEFASTDPGVYPGERRIVDAADQGCTDRLEDLGEGSAGYGIVAVWPTQLSWAGGDRDVVCAAYATDGSRFDGPTIIAS